MVIENSNKFADLLDLDHSLLAQSVKIVDIECIILCSVYVVSGCPFVQTFSVSIISSLSDSDSDSDLISCSESSPSCTISNSY